MFILGTLILPLLLSVFTDKFECGRNFVVFNDMFTRSELDLTYDKPHPAPLLHICSNWELQPNEVMMIGDSLKDDVIKSHSCHNYFDGVAGGTWEKSRSVYMFAQRNREVRRPSGRPQGILNIGVALLDGSMRSMPLYRQLSASAVGYRDLMQDPQSFQHLQQKGNQNNDNNNDNNNNNNQAPNVKPILRRSRNERSERATFDNYSPNSSIVAVPRGKDGSVISISESADPFIFMKKKRKASSVISGVELIKTKPKGKKGGKPSSVVSDSVYSKGSSSFFKIDKKETTKTNDESNGVPTNKVVDEKSVTKVKAVQNAVKPPMPTIGKPIQKGPLLQGNRYGGGGPYKANSIWSDSEVGHSPSEVAAAMMAERRYPLDDNQSLVLDGWSLDESVEGLRSKLERWQMELPPLYDNGFSSSSHKSSGRQVRKRNDGGGSGLFSCFGNICGYECQCVCGKPPGRKSYSSRYNSSSVGTPGRSFV